MKTTAEEIVKKLADWSKKYPRGRVYPMSKQTMDNELIEIENKAKEYVSLKEDKWISVETPPKTREQMKDRYFFFVYSFWITKTEGNISGTGNLILSSRFFPKKFDVNNIASKNVVKNYNVDYSSVDIVIQNFIEMNESDYLNFNS